MWCEPEGKVGGGRWTWAKYGKNQDGRMGDGRTMQCADDVLLSCTLETWMVL